MVVVRALLRRRPPLHAGRDTRAPSSLSLRFTRRSRWAFALLCCPPDLAASVSSPGALALNELGPARDVLANGPSARTPTPLHASEARRPGAMRAARARGDF